MTKQFHNLVSSGKPCGMIILHLYCINQDKKIRWHLMGIC